MRTYHEIKNQLLNDAYEKNIPLAGEFELTSKCNFSCDMCYAKSSDEHLSKEAWIDLFNQANESGMLYATLTGGEIFLQPDFIDLYEYLYDLGVKITLYTNGSNLPDNILTALVKRPPELIAITLYGFDKNSYKTFTKVDAFEKVSQHIDQLNKHHISLVLRTIPLPETYQYLDDIIAFSKSKNLHLGYFLYVSKNRPSMERLNASQLIDFESRIKKAFPIDDSKTPKTHCGAFKNGFFINHKGMMQGCAMMPIPSARVHHNFLDVFQRLATSWSKLVKKSPCNDCSYKENCFTCLANRYLEGNMFRCSDYLKAYAKESLK